MDKSKTANFLNGDEMFTNLNLISTETSNEERKGQQVKPDNLNNVVTKCESRLFNALFKDVNTLAHCELFTLTTGSTSYGAFKLQKTTTQPRLLYKLNFKLYFTSVF